MKDEPCIWCGAAEREHPGGGKWREWACGTMYTPWGVWRKARCYIGERNIERAKEADQKGEDDD